MLISIIAGEELLLPYNAHETPDMQEMVSTRTAYSKVLVEIKYYEGADASSSSTSLESELYPRQLASLLETAGSQGFHTLPFKGYIKEQSRYVYFFDYPPLAGDVPPQSLHNLIASKEKLSLKLRFHIAHTISRSISAFHSDGWVHKSVSSYAIKFFFKTTGACDFENPYLTDFELSRPDTGETRLIGQNSDPEGYIYQHPERQGFPTRFTKAHDIYSLGVVLLEIGLWEPAKKMYNDYAREFRRREPLVGSLSPSTIRKNLLGDASRRLEHRMGLAYKEAVVSCLSDEIKEYLKQDDFAMVFQKMVVQKVDIKRLSE
jgi:serine/threonine protein kinase